MYGPVIYMAKISFAKLGQDQFGKTEFQFGISLVYPNLYLRYSKLTWDIMMS